MARVREGGKKAMKKEKSKSEIKGKIERWEENGEMLESLDILSHRPVRYVEAIGDPFSHGEFISNQFTHYLHFCLRLDIATAVCI